MEGLNKELIIYSEEVKDVLSAPPKVIYRWGNTILLAFIVIIFFLACIIKYPDVVIAKAILTTEIPPQKEFANVTGKIDSLFVKNYQEVNKNNPLAIIENTANYKDVVYLKSILDTLKVDVSSFYFPLDTMPMLFLGDIENEFSLFENNYIQYVLNKESQSFLNNNLTNTFTLFQLRYRLQTLIHQQELSKEGSFLKKKDVDRAEKLFNKGVISTQEFENKKLEYLESERNFKNISVSISQIRERISTAKNTKKQTTINNTRTEINLFKSVIQSLDKLKTAIKEWELKYLFKSNINGTVSFMKIWNKNQTIHKGDFIFTVVPKEYSSYICKVEAPVLNSGKIKIGQKVNIKLSSYPYNEYGILKGKVKDISLTPNNKGFYLIDVILADKLITTYNKKLDFKQEMRGTADIITEDLKLIDRIFYQFKEVFQQ